MADAPAEQAIARRHSLAVVVPASGTTTLFRALDSIAAQRLDSDDQVVVYPSPPHLQAPGDVVETVASFGPQFSYRSFEEPPDSDAEARNQILADLKTDWVLFHSEHAIYAPEAFETIRFMANLQAQHHKPTPMYFRCEESGGMIWREAGALMRGAVVPSCMVAPRAAAGSWANDDGWNYIYTTSVKHEDMGFWHPQVIALLDPAVGWCEVTTYGEAEAMRLIRNECLLPGETPIDYDHQRTWLDQRDRRRTMAFLFYANDLVIGAGLVDINAEDNLPWVTAWVRPEHRGRGYGTAIFKLLSYGFVIPVYASVPQANPVALKACLAAGFIVTEASIRDTVLRSRTQDPQLVTNPPW